jgi:hypothetical protein
MMCLAKYTRSVKPPDTDSFVGAVANARRDSKNRRPYVVTVTLFLCHTSSHIPLCHAANMLVERHHIGVLTCHIHCPLPASRRRKPLLPILAPQPSSSIRQVSVQQTYTQPPHDAHSNTHFLLQPTPQTQTQNEAPNPQDETQSLQACDARPAVAQLAHQR